MDETVDDPRREALESSGKRYIVRDHFALVIHVALLLSTAQTLTWWNAWVIAGAMLVVKLTTALVLLRVNPAVLNARGTKREMSKQERVFFSVFVPSALLVPIVAGLDAGAPGWSHLSTLELGIGLGMIVLGGIVTIWALAVNAFFEATVRVQSDRGHRVCSAGPYAVIRHPGYFGAILIVFSIPLITGSRWALIPAAVESLALVVRIVFEERVLRAKLPGYVEYAERQARYRLIPFVW